MPKATMGRPGSSGSRTIPIRGLSWVAREGGRVPDFGADLYNSKALASLAFGLLGRDHQLRELKAEWDPKIEPP